jgi:hypothetical protein
MKTDNEKRIEKEKRLPIAAAIAENSRRGKF